MGRTILILLLVSVSWVYGFPPPSPPTLSLVNPQGIRFSYPDAPGVSLVAFHYSVNKPVRNVAAGDYNNDVTTKTGNEWVLENTAVNVHPGDRVHYWMNVVQDGLGKQLTDQVWALPAPTTASSTTTTTTTPITTTTTTKTPTTTATTSAQAVSGGTSPSCECAGKTIRPPGSERTCVQFPCLIFDDEFDTLNLDVWEHEITASGNGNGEFQYYTNNRTNSFVKDGKLYIKPTLTIDSMNKGPDSLTKGSLDIWGSMPGDACTSNLDWGCKKDGTPAHIINPIQSARLRSSRGFNFKYGKVDVRAKMPKGDWLWPAIWMLPLRNAYGRWPASGEIDIVESRGNSALYRDNTGHAYGNNAVCSTLHFGSDIWHNKWRKARFDKILTSGTFGDDFHNYTLIWDENFIKTYVDGDEVMNVTPPTNLWEFGGNDKEGVENPWRGGAKMAPFDQEFYLVMNVAVGGMFFPDTFNYNVRKPWKGNSEFAPRDFWNARRQWYPTWQPDTNHGEDAALQVDYIKVWKLKP